MSCKGSSPRPCNTPAPAARCPRVRRAHPWAQSLIRFALPTARVSFGSNWEGPAPAAALPVNLQQRKYLGTRRHRGQCQVLTIPPRSGALRVLGNRWVPKVDTLFKPFWEKAPTEVRAAWRGNSGSGKVRLRTGVEFVKLLHAFKHATAVFGWVRSHASPGATRHLIHGSDVCASQPRATAAMRRRFHGATDGATLRGAISGT